MENTQNNTQRKRKGLRIAAGIAAVAALVGVTTLAMRETPDNSDDRSQSPAMPRSSTPNPKPSSAQLFPSCGEIKRKAVEWKNDKFEIDFDPSSCNGTLTFHNPLMPHKQNELPFSRMPVTYAHNEADVTITVGKPDHKIPEWDRYVPRPGNYNVVLIDHNTFIELRLATNNKSYTMCAPWRPIPLCGEASPRRH